MNGIGAYEAMAKLTLNEDEREWALAAVARLEDRFASLAAVDTENVEPLVSVLDMENVFREDVAAQLVSREELLAAAPEESDGYWQVPKTLE